MAVSNKTRKITVDGIRYYFTVKLEFQNFHIETMIGLVENSGKRFCLTVEQGDPHLVYQANDKVGSVTPKLVARAIQYVTANTDWATTDDPVVVLFANNEITTYSWTDNNKLKNKSASKSSIDASSK